MFSPATLFDVASLTTFIFPDVHTQISKSKHLEKNNTHPELNSYILATLKICFCYFSFPFSCRYLISIVRHLIHYIISVCQESWAARLMHQTWEEICPE